MPKTRSLNEISSYVAARQIVKKKDALRRPFLRESLSPEVGGNQTADLNR